MSQHCSSNLLNRMGIGIPKLPYDNPEDVDKYNLAVVAKVFDAREFSEIQLQSWVDNVWKTNTAITIQKVSHTKDKFFFFCTSWEDRDNLMSLRSASYKGAFIVFKGWLMGSNVMKMDFSKTSKWIKVESIPTEECIPQMARRILERVRRIIRFDELSRDDRPHSLMRAKVVILVNKLNL
uniref:DUF4283 domain-containing protein n=1 Tax=Chenopodium quinoa TaxID=63459 RepID=A0A803MTY6_CHEQI